MDYLLYISSKNEKKSVSVNLVRLENQICVMRNQFQNSYLTLCSSRTILSTKICIRVLYTTGISNRYKLKYSLQEIALHNGRNMSLKSIGRQPTRESLISWEKGETGYHRRNLLFF
jgi:hypothetical protein